MRGRLTKIGVMVLVALSSVGCVKEKENPPVYIWGNYQYTSSAYGMFHESQEIVDKHLQEIENIINNSNEKGQRVAPGIYAEYGQMLYESGRKSDAKRYFVLEKNTYPESAVFIDRVLIKLYGEGV